MYADYHTPPGLKPPAAAPAGRLIWWSDIVPHWGLVVLDLADRYGVDLFDPAVLARPWPGVRTMILALPSTDSRLAGALREEVS